MLLGVDQATVGLLGAAIGAGGAVTAQIIAAGFTQRSTSKRFAWEQEQAARHEAQQRADRHADIKRRLCAAFLTSHRELIDEPIWDVYGGSQGASIDHLQEYVDTEWLPEIPRLEQEILLIASTLRRPCADLMNAALAALVTARERAPQERNRSAYASDTVTYKQALEECQDAMARHLSGMEWRTASPR